MLLFLSYIQDLDLNNKNVKVKENGYLEWHDSMPDDIIKQHKRYEKILKTIMSNNITNLFDTGNLLENYNPNYEQ